MKCQKCGFEIDENAKYCTNCGANIEFAPEPSDNLKNQSTNSNKNSGYQNYSYEMPQNSNYSSSTTKSTNRKHKKQYLIIILCVFVVLCIAISVANGTSKNYESNNTASSKLSYYQTIVKVNSVSNLMFSTYDIKVFIDGNEQGTIKNGEFYEYDLQLSDGEHTLMVCNADDESVKGEIEFTVSCEDNYQFKIFSRSDSIDIEEEDYVEETTVATTESTTETTTETTKQTTKDDSVIYSNNDYETAKKGNSGVFSYASKDGSYEVYWIIDFDEGYVYYFTYGNGEDDTYDKVKIKSGNLNDRVTITWDYDGEQTDWYIHFKYKNSPATIIVNDHLGFDTEFWSTDLDHAYKLLADREETKS